MPMTKTLKIEIAQAKTAYPVIIHAGMIGDIAPFIQKLTADGGFPHEIKTIHVVTDDMVAPLYLDKMLAALPYRAHQYIISYGEKAKNINELNNLLNKMLENKIDRQSVVVALGGGVIGDLAGFAAGIMMRGVPYIQVPTTLLAQVDSSVGGKTGINSDFGKNMIGAFHHPKAVLIDPLVLKTLPMRELKAGYAEVLKYSFINKPLFFKYLDENVNLFYEQVSAVLTEVIAHSITAKAEIVAEDPYEMTGARALLNLGHTFGHALETLGQYDGRLLHGEAVALGMRMAIAYSLSLGLCPSDEAAAMLRHMDKAGLIKDIPFTITADMILDSMKKDKKNTDQKISLILLRGLGKAFKANDVDPQSLYLFLKAYLAEAPQ
jgi:3-dehydroquinate synthase